MYSRRTCGLCDKARAVILTERERVPFRFEEITIDGDDELERRYGDRVPVVEVGEHRLVGNSTTAQLAALIASAAFGRDLVRGPRRSS